LEFEHEKQLAKDSGTHPLHSPHNPDRSHRDMLAEVKGFINQFFYNENIPFGLLLWGSLGQIIFTLRFVYQWVYSRRHHDSILPMGFWLISLSGSLIIVSYALVRHDPVLILGQSTGLVVYCRDIWILYKNKKQNPDRIEA